MPKAANAYKHLVDRCFHKATAGVPPVRGVEWCGQWKEAVKPWGGQLEELAGCYYRALDSAKSGEVVRKGRRQAGAGREARQAGSANVVACALVYLDR